jgi:hypothetical protein
VPIGPTLSEWGFQERSQQVTKKPPILSPKYIKSHLRLKEENCVANCAYIKRLQKTIVAFNTWVNRQVAN